jgi:hypothetical protein
MLYTAGISVSFGIIQECSRPINVHHVYNAYCGTARSDGYVPHLPMDGEQLRYALSRGSLFALSYVTRS